MQKTVHVEVISDVLLKMKQTLEEDVKEESKIKLVPKIDHSVMYQTVKVELLAGRYAVRTPVIAVHHQIF